MFLKFTLILAMSFSIVCGYTQTTELNAAFCPATVSSLGTNILCNSASGAEGYRFEIWDESQSTLIATYDSYANNRGNKFRFSWLGGVINYATTYAIRVEWYDLDTDTWSAPGSFCLVTTPGNPITQLAAVSCNSEVATVSTNILADQVTGAVQYRFEISIGGSFLENVDKNTYKLRLSDLTSPGQPTFCEMDIRVATKTTPSAAWSDFGASCSVIYTAPSASIQSVYCGTTINYLQQDTIHANAVSGAQGYRFKIESGGVEIEDTVVNISAYNGITLRKFPGVQYGQTYNVSVQAKVNGCFGSFGPTCSISTVSQPITELRPSQCGATIPSPASNLYGNSIIYAQEYEFRINGGVLSNEIFNTGSSTGGIPTSPRFRMSWLTNASSVSYGTTYAVETRVKIGGSYGDWGNACNITLQGSPVTELKPAFCGVALSSMGTNIYCNSVSLSQGYKFEVRTESEDLIGEYDGLVAGTSNKFRMSWVPGVLSSTGYRVRAAWNNGGTWSDYGSFCVVTTPASAIVVSGDGSLEQNLNQLKRSEISFLSYPNPFQESFQVRLDTETEFSKEDAQITMFDMQGRILENQFIAPAELSNMVFGRDFKTGTYLVKIHFNNQVFQQRIFKAQ
jgi:hypothetical protein